METNLPLSGNWQTAVLVQVKRRNQVVGKILDHQIVGKILDHQIVGKILDHQVVGKMLDTSNIAAVKVSQNYVVRLQMITDSATFESAVGTIALSITVQNFVPQ